MREQLQALIEWWRMGSYGDYQQPMTPRTCADDLAALLAVPVPHQEEQHEEAETVTEATQTGSVQARVVANATPDHRSDAGAEETMFGHQDGRLIAPAVPTGEGLRAAIEKLPRYKLQHCNDMGEDYMNRCYIVAVPHDGSEEVMAGKHLWIRIDQLHAALTASPDPTL